VGRALLRSSDDDPWWRVIGAKGDLLIAKRDPHLASQQETLLQSEGVQFREGRVESGFLLSELNFLELISKNSFKGT